MCLAVLSFGESLKHDVTWLQGRRNCIWILIANERPLKILAELRSQCFAKSQEVRWFGVRGILRERSGGRIRKTLKCEILKKTLVGNPYREYKRVIPRSFRRRCA